MSKTQRSSSRTHSRSASRSRSRSESHSHSRSRSSSRSRSRSRKHRYGSRSRSRSRSHSPVHNCERKHPRDFQNHREFRGYHRGFRRPYYFRGRGRGFFRGRFQRGGGGGGGGGCYNNRSNNWQNYRQYPQQKQHYKQQQQQQQQHQNDHNPKRGRSRSRSPKKSSNSPPQSRSHSRRSDRSSSPHSHHSSSSNSSRPRSASAKRICTAAKEDVPAPKESQKNGKADERLTEQAETEGDSNTERAPGTCLIPTNTSPKRASPNVNSAVSAGQGDLATNESGPMSVSSGLISNGATCWQSVTSAPTTNSLSKKSPTTVFSGFGLFSNADQQDEDTVAISIAFKKFLEEQRSKKQAVVENGIQKVASNGEALSDKKSTKAEGMIFDRPSGLGASKPADHNDKRESEKNKHGDSVKTHAPSSSSVSRPQFLCEDREEDEDEQTEPHVEMRDTENVAPKRKSKMPLSARELFEEHVSRLEDIAWDDELEAFLLSRKQERAASFLAALSKREKLARKFRDTSPEKPPEVKQKEKATLSPSPTYAAASSRRSPESREQEIFLNMCDESPPRPSGKRGAEFSLRMDSLSDDLARSSVLSSDRRNLVHPDKKEQEFHSAFQHLPCNNLCRSPSELFAQHVVAIVHHIKAQHFPSSGMTLNDRFAMYQRIAAEKEMMKQRKSPEIHRRIDVSPSAFKRHSLLFDDLKGSVDGSFKVDGKQIKGDAVDLRLDIERRKKYLSGEKNDKQEWAGGSGESELGVERSTEKSSKHHKKSKKSKKKRERTHSSSSSSSSLSQEEEVEFIEDGYSQAQLQLRECSGSLEREQTREGLHFRIRGRGWNKVNSLGNNTNANSSVYVPVQPKNADWDPEDMPKSRKYYLQDRKDVGGERKWAEPRGRGQASVPRVKGRFILRRPTCSITTNNSNSSWSYGKFQGSGEDGEQPGNVEQNHKEQHSV